jgi:hypothetical protein
MRHQVWPVRMVVLMTGNHRGPSYVTCLLATSLGAVDDGL